MAVYMTVIDYVLVVSDFVLSFPTGCLGWNLGFSVPEDFPKSKTLENQVNTHLPLWYLYACL